MHKRFSARKLVIVVLIFLVFIMNAYAMDEDDFSLNVDIDNSAPELGDTITVSVDIENENQTHSAEDFQLTSSYTPTIINYSSSSQTPFQIDDGSLAWNFTIENSTSILIDVNFEVIGNASTPVSFTLRNTSGESIISELINVNVISNTTESNNSSQNNQTNSTENSTQEENIYSLLDFRVDIDLENRSYARHVKGTLIVNTSEVNITYTAENNSNYTLFFKDLNITENSTGYLSVYSYNKSDFSGGATQYYEEDEDYSKFSFKDLFDKDNETVEIRLKEYEEDEVGTFLPNVMVTYVAPTYADFLGIDKEIIEKIREVKIEKKSYTNPQITNSNIITIKSQNSEVGDALKNQNASHERRNSKMNITYEVYEIFTNTNQRYFITEIEKELEISIKLEDSYYRILDYIPENITQSASQVYGKNFDVIHDESPVLAHELNFTGVDNATAKIRFGYMIQTNIYDEDEAILTGVFAREEYEPIFQSAPTAESAADEQDNEVGETQEQEDSNDDDNNQVQSSDSYSTQNTQLAESSDESDSNDQDSEIEVIEAADIDESYYKKSGADDEEPGFFGKLSIWNWLGILIVLYLIGDTLFFLRLKENRDRLKRAMSSDYKKDNEW